MTLLLDPENDANVRTPSRPLITFGVSAAGLATLFTLAVRFGVFAQVGAAPAPTIATLSNSLAEHQVSMEKQSAAEERALVRIVRLLELRCIQDARTASDRDACLRP